ncbi:MAG: VanW family protein [Polyangiaceae bacterium]
MNERTGHFFLARSNMVLMGRKLQMAIAVAAGAMVGVVGTGAVLPHLPAAPLLEGLRVGGTALPADQPLAAWLRERDRAYGETTIDVVYDDEQVAVPRRELGFHIDVRDTTLRAYGKGHRGSWSERLAQTAKARRGALDVPLSYRFDDRAAQDHLKVYVSDVARSPVNARLDLANRKKIADTPGRALDLNGTLAGLRRQGFGVAQQPDRVSLAMRWQPASVTLADLQSLDLSTVLSSYETRFAVYKRGRSSNVLLAAKLLDGLVMRGGQLMSFNERVGPRTRDRGFQFAPEIVGDELTVGVGGGTCQVSSTLHAAALYGGMDISQRKSHSRPSSYTRLGLDATVAYPVVDLKIRNPFPFTIVIHAHVPEPGKLRVELLGGEAVSKVRYSYAIAKVEPFVRRITVKPHLKDGRVFRKQKGTRGMDVFSFVTISYTDGRVEKRRYFSGYRPTPEVFWVAPGYDADKLPELPSWAKGVEGRLSQTDNDDYYPSTL